MAVPPAGRPPSLDLARYRVLERRDVRTAVEFELVVVPAFIAAELVVLGWSSPGFTSVGIAALLALGILAVAWRVGLRRRPHTSAFLIGVLIYAMGVVAAATTAEVAVTMDGLFAVVVIGAALLVPWSPRWHGAFLATSAIALAVGTAVSPIPSLQATSGLIAGASAIIVSAAGSWLARRRHLRMWGQALELRRQKAALGRTVAELEAAQGQVRRLEGILPICAACKRIRDGETWLSAERYVTARSDAQFSHGICPECAERLYPEDVDAFASA